MKDILIVLIISIIFYFIFFNKNYIQSENMQNTEVHTNNDYNI
jgi:hypothetical protein